MPDVSVLEIHLYGKKIGTLTLIQGDRSILSFSQEYIDDLNRPTLSLSFKDNLGGLQTEFRPVQTKVEPFFSNLLPEGPLRRYLAQRAHVKESREFFLLWALGADLPGAITLRPADGEAWPPPSDNDTAEHAKANAMRFSLAGVQLKFSALRNSDKGTGLTIPAKGIGGSWIVKLPAERFEGVPENEFAMMSMAQKLGMDVPEIRLLDVEEISGLPEGIGTLKGKALAIKRFDRTEDGPVHIEDFAQVFGAYPDDKYKKATYRSIATVLGIETDDATIEEYIRRLVFSTLIGNADMHLKNWSLIYPDRRTPRLSPAYDLLSTIPYMKDETAALKYARTKKMAELNYDELSYLAAKARLPEQLVLKAAKHTVEAFMEIWRVETKNLDVATGVVSAIDAHLKTLAILKE